MKLYNTLSRKFEEFVPITKGKVLFYHCGPTVYWTQHIGNLRGMTMGDLLVRSFRFLGYEVVHVRNYTDVGHLTSDSDTGEDKMEKGSRREGLTPDQIAQKYIDIFEKDTAALNLLKPTHTPRATAYVSEMINIVSELLSKGNAYQTDLAVYFDVKSFPHYTALSRQLLDELEHGSGKADVSDPKKKSPLDFALWFFRTGVHANALQHWKSPFSSPYVSDGEGFPGWHIECSAMCRKLLGNTIDIHMGGVEHIPVHHTNEIAQSECANGVSFVHYWLHNEHLVVNNEKMAKSQGTGMSLDEVIKAGFDPLDLRYFFLTAQYRSRQNFTWQALTDAKNARLELNRLLLAAKRVAGQRTMLSDEKLGKIEELQARFSEAIQNDLNIPQALAVMWETVKSNIPPDDKYDLVSKFDQVFGLKLGETDCGVEKIETGTELPDDVKMLLARRLAYRSQRKYAQADEVRKQIETLGFTVIDSPDGQTVKRT